MKDLFIKKLYYSISEVSEMTHLKPYVLRYWESEFPQLRPSKNRAGKRIYRSSDIELVLLIKKLLYNDKFTIEGARKRIGKMNEQKSPTKNNDDNLENKRSTFLTEMRKALDEMLLILDDD